MVRNEYHSIKCKVKEYSINIFDRFVVFFSHILRKKRLRITLWFTQYTFKKKHLFTECEKEKHRFVVSLIYAFIWLILLCALTGDRT